MECPFCGATNRAGTRYCGSCGKYIGATTSNSSGTSTAPTVLASNPNNSSGSGDINATQYPTTPSANGSSGTYRSQTPGSRLQGGRYIIKQVLGQGGMGAALLATDLRLDNKPVVIKELLSENVDPTRMQEDVRNFKREVATLAHIDHPLVPNVTDHFQEGTRYFMVQEYVEGENLEDRLDRLQQPLKEREALIYISQLLDVLDYLAQQTPPIVHRDIKPANIIISTRDKRAHLVDFGIARAEVALHARKKQSAALGTPGYAPPEQYQGNADPRSDLYALAATLHHLITYRDPRDHAPFSYPPARSLNPQISPETEQVLVRALNNDITQRYQSAATFKHDIDNILQQRFGIAGTIDSYTLGTASNFDAHKGSGPNTGAGANVVNHAHTAITPVQSLSAITPVNSGGFPSIPNTPPIGNTIPSQYPQQSYAQPTPRRKRSLASIIVIVVLLTAVVGALVGFFTLKPSFGNRVASNITPTASTHPTGIGAQKIGKENIGISDGTVAFDTALDDGSLKVQAAEALTKNSNDLNPVISLLNQALSKSSNDAEALIYKEDLRVLNSGNPYITLVVATMVSGDDSGLITVGRDDLQGAYVAQKEFNDASKLHGGMQIRILIANSGSKSDYVLQVAKQIVQLSQVDKTFIGVMGWPYSGRTVAAIKTLAQAHIPLISQTASSDDLTNASPYFFRVVPSNRQQAIAGAQYAKSTLNASKAALFYDQQDTYSQSLAQDFSQEFSKQGGKIIVEEKYTVGKPDSLTSALQDALKKNPDIIYFSGYASDVSTLLSNPLPDNLPVLGGDALYELGGYSSSARASGFTHLRFTAFAYPDEWDVLGYSSQKPNFFSEYPNYFDPNRLHQGTPYGFTRPDNDVILSYDATVTLLESCDNVLNSGKQQPAPSDIQKSLRELSGDRGWQGISGQIALGPDGNPIDKALVVLYVDEKGFIHMQQDILGRFIKS